jgi:hypothetical protein
MARFDDLFLDVSLQGDRKTFRVRSLNNKELCIEDLANRMGRSRASVYQLLRNLPLGTHGVTFQELIRKSAGRKYNARMTKNQRIVADSALAAAVHAARVHLKHDAGCALEIHHRKVVKFANEMREYARLLEEWKAEEIERKRLRAEGTPVPVFQPPAKPVLVREPVPPCGCGLAEAERALLDALDNCKPVLDDAA